jgi:ribulose-phosphate 3-epimerase
MLPKIAQIRKLLDAIGSSARLEVDGGVSETTLPALIAAGADTFVAGNAVFNHPNGIAAGVAALRSMQYLTSKV